MSEIIDLPAFFFLSFMIFCANIMIGVLFCTWSLENGNIIHAGMSVILTLITGGVISLMVLGRIYELIKNDEKWEIKQ